MALTTIVMDTSTYFRSVAHDHFSPGERVLIIRGSQDGHLTGASFTIVAPSWHQVTDTEGWRLRDHCGGETSYVTAAPKYLIHLDRDCTRCVGFFNQLKRWVLPALPRHGQGETNSYTLTDAAEIVHIADELAALTPS